MNKEFLNNIQNELKAALHSKYQLDDSSVIALSEVGQTSIISSLKHFVLKNGTAEIEGILLNKISFNGSELQKISLANLQKDISDKNVLSDDPSLEIADFSINLLINRFKESFQQSANTKDLDGICNFLGIDKKILGLVNSPVGKIFGKFF
jgi:hypothetical protein